MGPMKSASDGLIARLAPESIIKGKEEGIEFKGYRSTWPNVGWVKAVYTWGLKLVGSKSVEEVEKMILLMEVTEDVLMRFLQSLKIK